MASGGFSSFTTQTTVDWLWLTVIFGNLALGQIDRQPQQGRGLAIAGIVLGWIGVALLAILSFVWLGYGISNS